MALLLLLLSFCSRSCAVTLPQPSAVSAVVGSSVNLSCYVQVGADRVTEKNLYWYMPESHQHSEWFVFPDVTQNIPNNINPKSIRRANPNHNTDMTLTIDNVALRYTGTYFCHMSVRRASNAKKIAISGNGTYLLVHERLVTYNDSVSIICSTEVWEVDDVSLVWDVQGAPPGNFSRNSSRISIELLNRDIECRGRRNVTGTCLLQYKGMNLTKENLEIPCPGTSESGLVTEKPRKSQPMLLYILLLAGSLLILLIVILVFYVRRRSQGDNSKAVYINFEDKKRPNKSLLEMDM